MLNTRFDFKNFLIVLKNCFFVSSFLLFFTLISVKYKIFQLKKNIRHVQENIISLEREKKVLDLEIVYLSSPERLKKIYNAVQNMNTKKFENRELVNVKQIKDVKNLIPYYYEKADRYGNFIALKQ